MQCTCSFAARHLRPHPQTASLRPREAVQRHPARHLARKVLARRRRAAVGAGVEAAVHGTLHRPSAARNHPLLTCMVFSSVCSNLDTAFCRRSKSLLRNLRRKRSPLDGGFVERLGGMWVMTSCCCGAQKVESRRGPSIRHIASGLAKRGCTIQR